MRIGYGYDSHIFVENRKLILAGIEISYELGLKGHSDADVVVHAIIDSIFGALALGDIGSHFPDNDDIYKDICSMNLLKETVSIMKEKKYIMRKNLSEILLTDIGNISIKAKTNEKMDAIGRGEAIAVHCVSLLKEI